MAKSDDSTTTTATAEDTTDQDQRSVTLAHHYVDHQGVLGEAGASYAPNTTHTVPASTAVALAAAGLLVGVNPDDGQAVQDAGKAAS